MSSGGDRLGQRAVLTLLAAGVIGVGCLTLLASTRIPEGQGYTAVGPRVFPLIISSSLLALGLILLARVTVRPDQDLLRRAADEARSTYWPAPLSIALALLLYAVALEPLGFVLATAPFFAAVAWVLEDRRPARTFAIGLLLALITYLGFTRLLGVRLPSGLLDGIL